MLVFRKVARSCSLTKRLLKILKVAKKLPSRIWKGLLFTFKTLASPEHIQPPTPPPPPSPPPGVGHRWNILVGVCRRGLETLTLFWRKPSITTLVKTIGHFPWPSFISRQDPKNMSCFIAAWTCLGLIRKYPWACFIRASEADRAEFIERFHSCVQHLSKFTGKKEGVYIRKEFNSQRTDLEHQYGCRDVIWKRSIARSPSTTNINYCSKQPRIHNLNASTIAG